MIVTEKFAKQMLKDIARHGHFYLHRNVETLSPVVSHEYPFQSQSPKLPRWSVPP